LALIMSACIIASAYILASGALATLKAAGQGIVVIGASAGARFCAASRNRRARPGRRGSLAPAVKSIVTLRAHSLIGLPLRRRIGCVRGSVQA